MDEITLTSKGQVTLPKKVRKSLGVSKGDKLVLIEKEGEWVIKPKVKDPWKNLMKIRDEIEKEGKLLKDEDIKRMIRESKKEWSKFE